MSTLFADINTPLINDITLKRVLSPTVKQNIFQNIMLKPNEAVTEKFSNDTDAAEIQVLRVKPSENDARRLGSSKNGGWFNSEDASLPNTQAYGIQLIDMIDKCINIPLTAQGMINVDLLSEEVKNLGGLVSRNINAITIAAMLAKNFNNMAGYEKRNASAAASSLSVTPLSNWIIKDVSDKYTDLIIDASAKLDDGNADEGIDAYPDGARAVIVRPSVKAAIAKDMVGLYGGTGVYDVLRKGGLDTDTRPEIATSGYVGEVENMPVYCLSAKGWNVVEQYLGLAKGALNNLAAIVCSGIGTGRGLAFNQAIEVIPTQGGRGRQLQPLYRFGCECWDCLSVVPIFSASFSNPVKGTGTTLFVMGIGSREIVATPTADDTTDPTKVAFATTTSDASIYFTIDGTVPTTGSTLYSSALTLSSYAGKTIKVIAYKDGNTSGVLTYTVANPQ